MNDTLPLHCHGETIFYVHEAGMELTLCSFPDDLVHVCEHFGKDTVVMLYYKFLWTSILIMVRLNLYKHITG
jgi:hypothetical protein